MIYIYNSTPLFFKIEINKISISPNVNIAKDGYK